MNNLFEGVKVMVMLFAVFLPKHSEVSGISSKSIRTVCPLVVNFPVSEYSAPAIKPVSGNEKFVIVQIGDSHIQAGFNTSETRENVAAFMGEKFLSAGFVFPYDVCHTNSPALYSFSSEGDWNYNKITIDPNSINAGLAGIVLSTADALATLTVRQNPTDGFENSFDKVEVFYNGISSECVPVIKHPQVESSIYQDGMATFTFAKAEEEVTIGIENLANNAEFHITGMVLSNSKSKFTFHSAGLNGASFHSYLRALNFGTDLSKLNPNLVIVSLGTNDAYNTGFSPQGFEKDLDSLVQIIKRSVPLADILLTTPNDHFINGAVPNERTAKVVSIIKDYASANGCLVWDFYSAMGGVGSIAQWNKRGLSAPDLIHFSKSGYRLQGQLLSAYLTSGICYKVDF